MKRLLAFVFGFFALATLGVSASNYGSGAYGSCQYGSCSITLSSDTNVSLDITPTAGGVCSTQKDRVSVLTDSSNGYNLSLSSNSADTNLKNGSNTIATSSASYASPAVLPTNRWGYRVDGTGSFGAGPTSAATNAAASSLTYAGIVPNTSLSATLINKTVPANPADVTTVWYSVCADTTTLAGSYTTDALYTAVVN